ncbi:MAG: iron ABC transporter permease [Elusimicrobia bacterium]|nr:iron ABC transporter permease [Elusimicrobiota bacterium]
MKYISKEFEFYREHENKKKLKLIFLFSSFIFLFFLFGLSSFMGEIAISPLKVFGGSLTENEKYVFFNIRVVRIISAIFAGASLSLCGAVAQNILKNPMASPFTLGISQGAAFGASFAIIFLGGGTMSSYGEAVSISSYPVTVVFAFIGALSAGFFVFLMAYFKDAAPNTIVLTGVALGSLFQAITMFMQYFTSETKAAATLFWTFGDISKGDYRFVYIILFFFIPIFLFFFFSAAKLNAILWGKDIAKTLGVKVKQFNLISILLISVLTAATTAFLGVIGFIGLISPHLAKIIVGSDNKYFLPMSAILGSIVLLLSDMVSRFILAPAVIPVGIITSFWGIPLLIFLILKGQK